jgi:hypothetical protein
VKSGKVHALPKRDFVPRPALRWTQIAASQRKQRSDLFNSVARSDAVRRVLGFLGVSGRSCFALTIRKSASVIERDSASSSESTASSRDATSGPRTGPGDGSTYRSSDEGIREAHGLGGIGLTPGEFRTIKTFEDRSLQEPVERVRLLSQHPTGEKRGRP